MQSPDDKPVLILTGPPGAGKTTAARVLAERSERAVHIESDRFFQFIRSGFVEPWRPESAEQNEVVMRVVAGAGRRLRVGVEAWVELAELVRDPDFRAPEADPSGTVDRAELADRFEQGADPRAERYWQLLAVINGWPPVPTTMPAWRWTIDALRAPRAG